mgnify:CR=1 FL=1
MRKRYLALLAGRLPQPRVRVDAALRKQVEVSIDRKVLAEVGPQDLSASAKPPAFPVGEKAQ